ncbi:MAG: fused MFS/spermidine synthase [Deltaproteobacteria bacterium]|nr:fused MFS/spermidine synthase [Deltaproteobacteria bacterium]
MPIVAFASRRGALAYFAIFAVSGSAGLIYESIWTHYLKLFLGHAAYAQALVLAIFMGGMALGSWVSSRWSPRWTNLLRAYAVAEAGIGVAAFLFHPLYTGTIEQVYGRLFPALGSPSTVVAARWLIAGLLILPQSVLLGMTFPLMSAGVIRRYPERPGATLATLYFTNSIGAAVGVLASGFWLVAWVGLPGTLRIAGALNLAVAASVWVLGAPARGLPSTPPGGSVSASGTAGARTPDGSRGTCSAFLLVAAVTGASSFVYEIGWIRMLSLVLGSSTHAFELMLSAFITGLALGGLWVRGRIDRLADPVRFLALVQVAMGLLALATLPLYANAFRVMGWMVEALGKTPCGYALFSLGSHGIALAVVLPATFCAGTTLPLLTHLLLRRGYGERSIGAVYAWNTLGSIAGVILAIHVGMPLLGVKGLLGLGASLDMLLGVGLAALLCGARRFGVACAACTVVGLVAALALVRIAPHAMASGVYRTGKLLAPTEEVLSHRDGKTATVSVTRDAGGVVSLRTNGKPDASIRLGLAATPTDDESTMVLAGALPLAIHPQARHVANIGMGSGLTTNTLLLAPEVEFVDTIEIEPLMVAGARAYHDRVPRVFDDPRSRIHYDDAKSFFSSVRRRYDLIVSEPSNPWVSGVATLFSEEFYRRTKDYLAPGGLMVQWLQLYEIDFWLVASILKALSAQLSDWVVYNVSQRDLLIVASPAGPVPVIGPRIFDNERIVAELRRVGIQSVDDLEGLWCGNRRALEPLLKRHGARANSDFFPVLDQGAAAARFLGSEAVELLNPALLELPLMEVLGGHPRPAATVIGPSPNRFQERAFHARLARTLADYLQGGAWNWRPEERPLPPNIRAYADTARRVVVDCGRGLSPGQWFDAMFNTVARRVAPLVTADEWEPVWRRLAACHDGLDPVQREFLSLVGAVERRDGAAMARGATSMLRQLRAADPFFIDYLVTAGMLGHLAAGERPAARALYERYRGRMSPAAHVSFRLQLLRAHAGAEGP